MKYSRKMNQVKKYLYVLPIVSNMTFMEINMLHLLQNKIFDINYCGSVSSFLSAPKSNEKIFFPCNKSLEYIGGFFHETRCDSKNECDDILDAKISRLEEADLVVVILNNETDITTFSELIYASFLNKEIVVFANPNHLRFDKNYSGWYTFVLCKELNENITFINDIKPETIIKYLKQYKSSTIYPETPFAKKVMKKESKKEELKLFFSATFGVDHKKVTKENVETLLQKNIRTHFLEPKQFAYEATDIYIEKNLKYIGNFYYHMLDLTKFRNELKDYELLSKSMIADLDNSDVVTIVLEQYTNIGVIQELLYASFRKKKVLVLYYPEITNLSDTSSEYWFSILLAQRINPKKFHLQPLEDEKDIKKYMTYKYLKEL